MELILEVDETYRIDGKRAFYNFTDLDEAVEAYHSHRRGMVSLVQVVNGRKSLVVDEQGRKYIKGSPFYKFPHVHHRSIIDDKEIPTT